MISTRVLVSVCAVMLTACGDASAKDAIVTAEDNCPVRLTTGQILQVTLPSTPSAGYSWFVEQAAPAILRPALPAEVVTSPRVSDTVGAAVQTTWRFQAFAQGEGRLRLAYMRPWEKESPPARTFECVVAVQG